jgi:UDP-N-acetylglucosamine--N-acetylmuramyl-(pentapeptide) pyrophosphoryl-undecaprenol N-acetylglucosamine transferase
MAKLPLALRASGRILREFRPHLAIGVGGYSAGPVAVAARMASIPVVLHEQNVLPGITNRMLAPLAARIYVSFENTRLNGKHAGRVRVLGNPVRGGLLREGQRHKLEGQRRKGAKAQRENGPSFTVAVLGGSQGAHAVNLAMIEATEFLKDRKRIRLIHQTGIEDEKTVADAYGSRGVSADVRAFFQDMGRIYAEADLIVCRAGATTVAEVTAMGKPSILIPFPYAADDHQTLNAREPAQAGAAELMPQKEATGRALADRISFYADHPEARRRMADASRRFGKPDAARRIIADIYQLLGDG